MIALEMKERKHEIAVKSEKLTGRTGQSSNKSASFRVGCNSEGESIDHKRFEVHELARHAFRYIINRFLPHRLTVYVECMLYIVFLQLVVQ